MSNTFRTRLYVERVDAQITPSAAFDIPSAFTGLDVAGTLVPPSPISPVFVGLGHGSVDTPA
jgi:hypothetical protein